MRNLDEGCRVHKIIIAAQNEITVDAFTYWWNFPKCCQNLEIKVSIFPLSSARNCRLIVLEYE